MRVFVTVGLGPWPFDRLVRALDDLVDEHDVVAQIGTSRVRPRCPHVDRMGVQEFSRCLEEADVVVTHAGNTVRVVQRLGRVPVAVARLRALGEMRNDHQLAYLRHEQVHGRVLAVHDVGQLRDVVSHHEQLAAAVLDRPLPAAPTADQIVGMMEAAFRSATGRARLRRRLGVRHEPPPTGGTLRR